MVTPFDARRRARPRRRAAARRPARRRRQRRPRRSTAPPARPRPPAAPRRRRCCGRSSRPSATACRVVAGVGSNDTEHSEQMARDAVEAGATGCWSSRRTTTSRRRPASSPTSRPSPPPPRDLPVMLYDIPGRSGHRDGDRHHLPARRAPAGRRHEGRQARPRGRRRASSPAPTSPGTPARTPARCRCSRSARVGVVGTSTHLAARGTAEHGRRLPRRRRRPRPRPALRGCCPPTPASSAPRAPSSSRPRCALLRARAGPVRLPLVDATPEQVEVLRADLDRAGSSP